jgi:hypothetical protein
VPDDFRHFCGVADWGKEEDRQREEQYTCERTVSTKFRNLFVCNNCAWNNVATILIILIDQLEAREESSTLDDFRHLRGLIDGTEGSIAHKGKNNMLLSKLICTHFRNRFVYHDCTWDNVATIIVILIEQLRAK